MISQLVRSRGLTRLFSSSARPPIAKKLPTRVYFGKHPDLPDQFRGEDLMDPPIVRSDDYYWLRDESRKNEEVLNHIKAENAFVEAAMKPLDGLREKLYKSMLSRLKETDEDVPYPYGDYLYYSRTVEGLSYRIHCRKPKQGGSEQVILDENEVAKGHEYSVIGSNEISPSNELLAWSWDTSGDEHYTLHFRDLTTGQALPDVVDDISGDVVWSADNKAVFYMKQDSESRPFEAYMHVLGTRIEEDVMLWRETDALFWMGIDKTADERFLIISVSSKETSESKVIDLKELAAAAPGSNVSSRLLLIEPRKFGVRYEIESQRDHFLIVTNKDGAKCNKLMKTKISNPSSAHWVDVVKYDSKTQVDGVQPFRSHVVIFGRQGGLERVWLASANQLASWRPLEFSESCFSVWAGENAEYDSDRVRLVYSSLVTPKQVFEVVFENDSERRVLKQQDIPNYDATLYRTCRINLSARDGVEVPVSLVFKASLLSNPTQALGPGDVPRFACPQKCLLYGYGSYGACIDPTFDYKKITLLDHDVVYCIGHIRGGGELGQWWYEDVGKYLKKTNTFSDFADVAKGLIAMNVTETPKLAMVGRSAGGLLVGAVLNRDGHLFKAAVADVPFVDVLQTMADPTIPLTVGEWEEWGNPNQSKYFETMLSYSPYDNVERKDYPSLLVTAGLNDPRVQYWEPAKWVAKLREMRTNPDRPLYLKTDMSSGHFSASDRYKFLKETAFEYAFIVNELGGEK